MPTFPIYQADAFTAELFGGNPAAVVILDEWIDESLMQKIGAENNLSETAFVVKTGEHYEIRWFTPAAEVELCGHATLASAFVLFNHFEKDSEVLSFQSLKRGMLTVRRTGDVYELDFPADTLQPIDPPTGIVESIGKVPLRSYRGKTDFMLEYATEQDILDLAPDFVKLKSSGARGVIVSAPGNEVDFVSRFFAPAVGINEDPVTGSAHTTLIPFWSERVGKRILSASQLSSRGGELQCIHEGDRVKIGGRCSLYLTGTIHI